MKFDILINFFFDYICVPNLLVVCPKIVLPVCPKIVLPVEYMVLVAIYIIIPGCYHIYCNNVSLVYKKIHKLALFIIYVSKYTFYL